MLWCNEESKSTFKFRVVFSIYLQTLKVRQLPKHELYAIFKGYSKWEIALWSRCSLSVKRFVKVFFHASEMMLGSLIMMKSYGDLLLNFINNITI